MIDSEVMIKVEGVRKKFCRSLKKSLWYGLKDMAAEVFGGNHKHDLLRKDEFWAVNGVSFEVKRGQCLGLIGRNGAGKTTLLKMLNGLIKPDHGRIEMRGRVGALIALGAGFNPILTGRENIYVNGSVLGLAKREIDGRIEEIIDFADIRDFIDMPVQNYSSGMQVRLGFSVATALEPDVVLLDEVLAVGDAAFRFKCYNRIAKLMRKAAVILVTHNMEHIAQICTSCMMLSSGAVRASGSPTLCISAYDQANESGAKDETAFTRFEPPINAFELEPPNHVKFGSPATFRFRISCEEEMSGCFARVAFYGNSGAIVGEYNTKFSGKTFHLEPGSNQMEFTIPPVHLKANKYPLSFVLHDTKGMANCVWSYKQFSLLVTEGPRGFADYLIT
jgi:lipopolysaccharide transport system ATP-binding protein